MSEQAYSPLRALVIGEELVIRVGVKTLAHAIAAGNDFHQFEEEKDEYIRHFAITNPDGFARDVMGAMLREEEDGSTPLSKLMDEMAQSAIDDGSGSVEYEQSVTFGERSPLEKW